MQRLLHCVKFLDWLNSINPEQWSDRAAAACGDTDLHEELHLRSVFTHAGLRRLEQRFHTELQLNRRAASVPLALSPSSLPLCLVCNFSLRAINLAVGGEFGESPNKRRQKVSDFRVTNKLYERFTV